MSMLDKQRKRPYWPWDSPYMGGSGLTLLIASVWSLHIAALAWLLLNVVWIATEAYAWRERRRPGDDR